MATFGLTLTGFARPTLDEIRTAIVADIENFFGKSVDTQNGLLARFVAILAERYESLWDALEAVYNQGNPDTATGVALDALCLLTGTFRLEAVYSSVVLTLTGTPSTVVPAARQVSTLSTNAKFLTAAAGTITSVSAYAPSTVYAEGSRTTNNFRVYQALNGGTSGSSSAPDVDPAETAVDNDITWLCLGDGTGAVDVAGQSLLKGPIVGVARDILARDTPYGGWSGVINVLDAKPGYDTQSDESLRLTREEELAQPGTSTADAIRAALLFLSGVSSVTVFHNDTDVTDGDGLTPHTIEALIRGGADAEIGSTLLAQVAAGIQTAGNVTTNPVDSQGVSHPIKFSRPDEFNIGVAVTVVKDPLVYPADGDEQVKLAIATGSNSPSGDARKCGVNVRASAVSSLCFKVPGVLEVTVCNISSVAAPGTPPAPSTNTSIAISLRQLAVFDTSWITVTSSNDTP